MTRPLEAFARLLPREDREAVLGDICESGLSNLSAYFDLSALIWRRCLPPYAGPGDGVCIAVAALISPLLVGLSVALSAQASREIHASSFLGIVELLRLSALLWTASLGVGIAAMSRARIMAVLTTIAILAPAIVCALRYHGSDSQIGIPLPFRDTHNLRSMDGIPEETLPACLAYLHAAVDADPGAAHPQRWLHSAERFSPGSACAVLLVDQILRSPSCPFISASLM